MLSSCCKQPEPCSSAYGWLTASPLWLQVWTMPLCLWAGGLRKVRLHGVHGCLGLRGSRLHRPHLDGLAFPGKYSAALTANTLNPANVCSRQQQMTCSGTHVCFTACNAGPANSARVLSTLVCWSVGGLLEIPIEVFDSELAWRVNGCVSTCVVTFLSSGQTTSHGILHHAQ